MSKKSSTLDAAPLSSRPRPRSCTCAEVCTGTAPAPLPPAPASRLGLPMGEAMSGRRTTAASRTSTTSRSAEHTNGRSDEARGAARRSSAGGSSSCDAAALWYARPCNGTRGGGRRGAHAQRCAGAAEAAEAAGVGAATRRRRDRSASVPHARRRALASSHARKVTKTGAPLPASCPPGEEGESAHDVYRRIGAPLPGGGVRVFTPALRPSLPRRAGSRFLCVTTCPRLQARAW